MTPGALYLIRGGSVVRYHNPVHPAIGPDGYLRQVTAADARFLRVRHVSCKFRGLNEEASWMEEVMAEVGVTPSVIPDRLSWNRA